MIARSHPIPLPLTLLCALLSACGRSPAHAATEAPASTKPLPVRVTTVEQAQVATPSRYSGTLEPAVRLDLAFRVGGYVESLGQVRNSAGTRAIDIGDVVRAGTVLARVRAADYAEKLAMLRAQSLETRAGAKLAEDELERAKRLFESGAFTRAELDAKAARADSARAQLTAALARARDAELSLGDTVLRAPMDAVVQARPIEIGSLVTPGQPAFTLADTRNMIATFGAPQALVEKLRVGSPVRIFVGAESPAKTPEKLLDAEVTRIAPAADANGRVFSVEAALPNPDRALRPGAVVSIHVPDALAEHSLSVPLGAVLRSPRDPRGFAVYVLEGAGERANARLREVRLGEVVASSVTVREGVTLGQRVVTVGASLLRDGNPVAVIR